MKLLLRHLLRSARRAPLQPILILITVICSVAISTVSIRMPAVYSIHAHDLALNQQELGDILITLNSNSPTRMLFDSDAAQAIGTDGEVLGEYRLTGFFKKEVGTILLSVSATDLLQADRYHAFRYTAYGSFTAENLKYSVILSDACAAKLGLGIGDTLTLSILGKDCSFTVQAIAPCEGLLSDTDLLIPIERAQAILAERVPAIASLGDGFRPYNRLAIKTAEGVNPTQLTERLSQLSVFSHCTLSLTNHAEQYSYLLLVQTLSLWIPVLLLLILTSYLILTALRLLQQERSAQLALFEICGAEPRQMKALQYMEGLFYGLLGGIPGILLASPLLRIASGVYRWIETPVTLNLPSMLFGILWAPFLMTVCTAIHLRSRPDSILRKTIDSDLASQTPKKRALILISFALTAILLAATILLPSEHRLTPAILTLLASVLLLTALVPPMIQTAARGMEALIEKSRHPAPWLICGIKQLKNCFSLQHVGQIASLAVAFLLTVSSITTVLTNQASCLNGAISAELIATQADQFTEEALKKNTAVKEVTRLGYFPSALLENGLTVFGISVSSTSMGFAGELRPDRLPSAGETVIAEGIAGLLNAEVNSTIQLTVNQTTQTLTVIGILRTAMPMIYFQAADFDLSNDLLAVDLRNECPIGSPEAQEVIALLEQNGCFLIDPSEVFNDMPENFSDFSSLLRMAMGAAVIVAVVGIANSLAEQYRRRKHDRQLFRTCGMTGGMLFASQVFEILTLLLLSALFAIPFHLLFCWLIDLGVLTFGIVFIL